MALSIADVVNEVSFHIKPEDRTLYQVALMALYELYIDVCDEIKNGDPVAMLDRYDKRFYEPL